MSGNNIHAGGKKKIQQNIFAGGTSVVTANGNQTAIESLLLDEKNI